MVKDPEFLAEMHRLDVELDPLPSFERRIVHEHLRSRADVETHSEGDEPDRFVVVAPAGD